MRKLRTLIALLTAAALVLSFGGFAAAQFSDIPSGAKYAKAVDLLAKIRVVEGYPDNTFRPDELLTREQFATFVIRALGKDKLAKAFMDDATTFKDDAKISSWARGYVVLASSMKIITGFPDGTFRPQEEVTYAQVFAMLVRALGFDAYAKSKGGWPAGYLLAAHDLNLTDGLDDFVADLPIDRADMAQATYNAVVADFKADDQDKDGVPEPVENPSKDGTLSWLHKYHGYSSDEYAKVVKPAGATVSGKVEQDLEASQRVKLVNDATLYSYADQKDANNNVVAPEVYVNNEKKGVGAAVAKTYLDKDKVVKLTLQVSDPTKIKRIDITEDTFTNKIGSVDDIVLTPNETMYGKIKTSVTNAAYEVNVTADTTVVLDGQSATWADVQKALKALKDAYGSNGKGIFAVIRTFGNANASSAAADAIYVSVITKNTISGKVTAKGNDGKDYVRLKPDSGDEVKVYVADGAAAVGIGETVTLLRDAEGTARVVLKTTATATGSVFWAHALTVEYITVGGDTYLVNINAHTAKMTDPVTALYAGHKNSNSQYDTVIDTTYVKGNNVVAIRLAPDGTVEKIWGFNDPSPAFNATDFTVAGSTLHWGNGATNLTQVSGIWHITTGSGGSENGQSVLAGSDVVILQANGSHSSRTLADVSADDIQAVFYVLKNGVRSAQVILLKNLD